MTPSNSARTLITFIGTGDYLETTYRWPAIGEYKTAYIAAALGRLWNATAIVALATHQAEEKHGSSFRANLFQAGLPEPVFKRLPDGRTEAELWGQFQAIRETIESATAGGVLLDITHGFRAQPFFAGAVLNVLRAARIEPDDLTLVYGELAEPASAIWDLGLFLELMDWAQALDLFLRTGVAGDVVQLGQRIRRREAARVTAGNAAAYPRFYPLVQALERFADDLATVRVASIITGYAQADSEKLKAQGSALTLLNAIERTRQEVGVKIPPLALIFDHLTQVLRPLCASRLFSAEGQHAQHMLARHYLSLGRYPEAAAVVREARINGLAPEPEAVEVNSPGFDSERRRTADLRFSKLDAHAREIAEVRNDIEHCGFRNQPLPAHVLKKRVAELVDRFSTDEMAKYAATRPQPQARCIFVSRHPGAVEWAARQGLTIHNAVEHLDVAEILPGDIVAGTLPVHIAAEVRKRGGRYLHLTVQLPPERRGLELTADDMDRFGARLEEYRVEVAP